MAQGEIARHRTAMSRTELSRPLRLAITLGLLTPGMSVMDFGCGLGGDVKRLKEEGYDCSGWDPVHAPDGAQRKASFVNLGYVVNVIENSVERQDVLKEAWGLAERLLVISARMLDEAPVKGSSALYADGLMTKIGTFQKFFEQQELRTWIEQTLGVSSVAAAPGVIVVYRDDVERQVFMAARFRSVRATPRVSINAGSFEKHRALLEKLADFFTRRGRLPGPAELLEAPAIELALGSLRRAQRVLESISDPAEWLSVREQRSQDLLLILALSRFERRLSFSDLAPDVQLDVKALFGSYSAASKSADSLLFSVGKANLLDAAFRSASCGKLMPNALYVHIDALAQLPIMLRAYEGCARTYAGTVSDANIVKLNRREPKVSYLAYPGFEDDPHPALAESTSVHLQTFRIRARNYRDWSNPPILHRKEEFVSIKHPLWPKFARLTQLEEAKGLYADPSAIGLREGWAKLLAEKGLALRGHRLVRCAVR